MKNKTFIQKAAIAAIEIRGGLSCTTSFIEEEPLKVLSSGIEILQGTLRIDSFDRYENLITGREKIQFKTNR
jgi:hypothetical protein